MGSANVDRVIGIIREQDDKLNRIKAQIFPGCGFEPVERYERWRAETKRLIAQHLENEVGMFDRVQQEQPQSDSRLKTVSYEYQQYKAYFRLLIQGLEDGSIKIVDISQPQASKRTDRQLMERAIELAKRCVSEAGKVSPKVGAVLARDGIILGEAYRGELRPGEHAEYTLLERKLKDEIIAGATLFTTLEPCTTRNHPKVPCASRVADRKIAKVIIGTLDRNEDIRGRGEFHLMDAGIQIGRFDSDLMPRLEDLNREFIRDIRERTKAQTKDPVDPGAVGPNGFKIGYTENGDKVEWIEEDGEVWPMVLRRNDNHILEEYSELQDRVWYVRKLIMFEKMESGEEERKPEHEPFIEAAIKKMKKMEEEFGTENLVYDDVEWGIVQGKMAALAWVLGSDWDGAFDT